MFKQILVAIDNSEPAYAALNVAAALTSQLGGELTVVHVIDDSRALRPDLGIVDETLLRDLRRGGAAVLELAMSRLPADVPRVRILAEGAPGEMILATARNRGADLIVIGSDGRGRLAHFLLGSTADAVIRRAPCPVVAVRADRKAPDAPEPGRTPQTAHA